MEPVEDSELESKVKHPKHYSERAGVECIAIAETFNFNLGNVIKYVWRAGDKEGQPTLLDLHKAKQYVEFEIRRIMLAEAALK